MEFKIGDVVKLNEELRYTKRYGVSYTELGDIVFNDDFDAYKGSIPAAHESGKWNTLYRIGDVDNPNTRAYSDKLVDILYPQNETYYCLCGIDKDGNENGYFITGVTEDAIVLIKSNYPINNVC